MATRSSMNGIRFSGLETQRMKDFGSSLLLPETVSLNVDWLYLPPIPVRITEKNSSPYTVNFPGSSACLLECCDGNSPDVIQLFVVAGKCHFTKADYKKSDSFDERNVLFPSTGQIIRICPVCAKTCKFNKQYWLVLQMLQAQGFESKRTGNVVGRKMVSRLVCLRCFEKLVRDETFSDGSQTPVLDTLNSMPGIPLMLGAGTSPRSPNILEGKRILRTLTTRKTAVPQVATPRRCPRSGTRRHARCSPSSAKTATS